MYFDFLSEDEPIYVKILSMILYDQLEKTLIISGGS